ncbi:MAG: carboxypeptidase-like regulatory domain-containing protein [Caldimonas sp.]
MRRIFPVWCLFLMVAAAHSLVALSNSSTELPDAPSPQMESVPAGQRTVSSSSSISGTVFDLHGAAIPEVQVTLSMRNKAMQRTVTVDGNGAFLFAGLLPGEYTVTIDLPGQAPIVATNFTLGAHEQHVLPFVTSRTPKTSTTVHVVANIHQVAQAQVQIQEKQRVLGVVPNFYTSYIWNSAPMTPKLKFQLALRAELDPIEFLVDAGVAGVEQYHNTFPGYGGGWQGYGKRFGSAYADSAIGALLGRAVLPTIFHQDPRYFYRGTGSIHSRAFYALKQTFVTRGDNGNPEPNYSHLMGNFATAGISNIYRAPSDRTVSLTMRDALIVTAGDAAGNLLREFLSRKVTTNVPAFAKGKR